MSKNELFFQSSDGVTNIHMVTWEPDGDVLGIVQVNHGISEHVTRYEEFAHYLNSKGILVTGIDYLGHGMSTNNGNKEMYFGPEGSYKFVVDDIHYALTQVKNMYPDVPYTMLGFSLGSFLTRSYMIDYSGILAGAVLAGTGYMPKLKYKFARMIIDREAKKYGEMNATEKIRNLSFGIYNKFYKPNRTTHDWLCKSESAVDDYLNDELRGKAVSTGLFRELLNVMLFNSNINNMVKMNKTKPLLLLSGLDDHVGDKGKLVTKTAEMFKSSGVTDVSMKLYPELRHDILHEDERETVYNDIYEWLSSKGLVLSSKVFPKEEEKEEGTNESLKGLVDYDEYDIVWPDAINKE